MAITHLGAALPPPGTGQQPAIIVSKQGTLIIEIPQETPSKNYKKVSSHVTVATMSPLLCILVLHLLGAGTVGRLGAGAGARGTISRFDPAPVPATAFNQVISEIETNENI